MSNLALLVGSVRTDDIIESVAHGLYVSDVAHAWFEPETGIVSLEVEEGTLIENGELTHPAQPSLLTVEPLELLRGIVAVGDDFAWEPHRGYCLKDGSGIPIGVGQPTVRLDAFTCRAL
jgi:TldD protein